MKTRIFKYIVVIAVLLFTSCEKLVENINDNPNQLTLDNVKPSLFLNGAELSNIDIQLGYLNRMAGFYTGQLIGLEQIEKSRYEYSITNATFDWNGYQTVISPIKEIRKRTTDNPFYQAITKVIEANLIGTYASLFGDVPHTEAVTDIENPKFDDQLEIFKNLQTMLSEAIEDLNKATGFVVEKDYVFAGNRVKWLESAYTLKARYYMLTKEYDLAYTAAQSGISSKANSMMFLPMTTVGDNSSKNKIFLALSNAFTVGNVNSYLVQLLNTNSSISRNNVKTNEAARLAYYTINHANPTANTGIAAALEPQPIITYQENLLILAEAGARTKGLITGLSHLNTLRAALNTGTFFNSSVSTVVKKYDPYIDADFNAGGIENKDNIIPLRALLREIIEERYISGFTTFMPYDDSRRLKKSDSDISVPFPLNVATATQNIERFLFPADEVASNNMSPADPGMFSKTKVNK
ncbi:MAG: hypothetical protein CVU13_04550 [Bacteroidetes bacterium HGW-Bacteroidetes-8]|jgi:hypothetical protein|nr:MAG: hypothetical protein CVU13_04550 [Bacteroidetes bacterium HGW-Bacteroidetes-8]